MECKSITSHVSIFSNYGTIRPCCSININDKFVDWEPSSIFHIDSLDQSLRLPVRKQLYNDLTDGWIEECKYCKNLIPGVFPNEKGHWGRQRVSINI